MVFSHSADPYVAAENFLTANDLPAHYLDEVAQFIIKNAGKYRGPPSTGVTDPFTGMGRPTTSVFETGWAAPCLTDVHHYTIHMYHCTEQQVSVAYELKKYCTVCF